ncbi:MAG: uncharacterized protein A8A55_1025, partial [Amphiamblys sp. WSBS2006]
KKEAGDLMRRMCLTRPRLIRSFAKETCSGASETISFRERGCLMIKGSFVEERLFRWLIKNTFFETTYSTVVLCGGGKNIEGVSVSHVFRTKEDMQRIKTFPTERFTEKDLLWIMKANRPFLEVYAENIFLLNKEARLLPFFLFYGNFVRRIEARVEERECIEHYRHIPVAGYSYEALDVVLHDWAVLLVPKGFFVACKRMETLSLAVRDKEVVCFIRKRHCLSDMLVNVSDRIVLKNFSVLLLPMLVLHSLSLEEIVLDIETDFKEIREEHEVLGREIFLKKTPSLVLKENGILLFNIVSFKKTNSGLSFENMCLFAAEAAGEEKELFGFSLPEPEYPAPVFITSLLLIVKNKNIASAIQEERPRSFFVPGIVRLEVHDYALLILDKLFFPGNTVLERLSICVSEEEAYGLFLQKSDGSIYLGRVMEMVERKGDGMFFFSKEEEERIRSKMADSPHRVQPSSKR